MTGHTARVTLNAPDEVDGDDGIDLFGGHVLEGGVAQNARVVDQNVDPTECVDGGLHDRGAALREWRPSRRWRPRCRPVAVISSTTAWAADIDVPVPSTAPAEIVHHDCGRLGAPIPAHGSGRARHRRR